MFVTILAFQRVCFVLLTVTNIGLYDDDDDDLWLEISVVLGLAYEPIHVNINSEANGCQN